MPKLSNDRAMEMPKFVIRTIFSMFNNKAKRVWGNINKLNVKTAGSVSEIGRAHV